MQFRYQGGSNKSKAKQQFNVLQCLLKVNLQ